MPDSDDTAEFSRGFVAYTVTFPGNSFPSPPRQHVIHNLVVRTNEVGFADSPVFLQPPIVKFAGLHLFDDSIIVGEQGDVAILNTTLSNLSGAFAQVGYGEGASGTFNVNSGTVTLINLGVGIGGTGTVNITGTGRVSTELSVTLGILSGSGTATVRGVGSSLTSRGDITLSNVGTSTLNVLEGGAVTSESGRIGFIGTSQIGNA